MSSSQDTHDPLEVLLYDADEVNRADIATALQGIVGIDTRTGSVVLRPDFRHLSARQKILGYLLARKVAMLLGKSETEEAKAKTIIADTGVASGTVHPTLKELREARILSQTRDSAYYLSNHQIHDALEILAGKVKGASS